MTIVLCRFIAHVAHESQVIMSPVIAASEQTGSLKAHVPHHHFTPITIQS